MALSKELRDAGPRIDGNGFIGGNDGFVNIEFASPLGKQLPKSACLYTGRRGKSTEDGVGAGSELNRGGTSFSSDLTSGSGDLFQIDRVVPVETCLRDGKRGTSGSEDQYDNYRIPSWKIRAEAAELALERRLKGKKQRRPSELHVNIKRLIRSGSLFIDDDGTRYEPLQVHGKWMLVEVDQVDSH